MTPDDPEVWRQTNAQGGTGFIGGEHYHLSASDPQEAVQASINATRVRTVLGPRIEEWSPKDLGVPASIAVNGETSLTPYLSRTHDRNLLASLTRLRGPGAGPRLVLVVGTSCTGKTRSLFEAAQEVLPDWPLAVPRTDSGLASILLDGIPAGTVIWLDELQDLLTRTTQGITAAKAIRLLIDTPHVGPILFAGTIWPTNLATMRARPSPVEAAIGAGAIPTLLDNATAIEVPEVFTDADLGTQMAIRDPRLRKAISTAHRGRLPDQGRKVIQVLAGGTQLVDRLYPPEGIHPDGEFSPAAKAVLLAAGDLRRIGVPNPLPDWALKGAAPGYLAPLDARPPEQWLPTAIAEATRAASWDDPFTATRTLNIAAEGVPALSPDWITNADGSVTDCFVLHDFLLQEHLQKSGRAVIPSRLWSTLVAHSSRLDRSTALNAGNEAERRGLTGVGIDLMRGLAHEGDWTARERLVFRLGKAATQGDVASLIELRHLSHRFGNFVVLSEVLGTLARASPENDWAIEELALLPQRGGSAAKHERRLLAHLEHLSRAGDTHAIALLRRAVRSRGTGAGQLARALASAVQEGDRAPLNELLLLGADSVVARPYAAHVLIDLVEAGDTDAAETLRLLLHAGVPRGTLIAGLAALATQGDRAALTRLRTLTEGGTKSFMRVLAHLAVAGDQEALTELKQLAKTNKQASKRYKQVMLAVRHSPGARG